MANYFHGTPNVENFFSFWLKNLPGGPLPSADTSAEACVGRTLPSTRSGQALSDALTWTFLDLKR